MTLVARWFSRMSKRPATESNGSGRRFVALVGTGSGPKVAIRSENARLRISGLSGGKVTLHHDAGSTDFESDGVFDLPPSEFAKVVAHTNNPVVCEILT